MISGLGMGFLGAREREHLERRQFLEKVSRLLQFDRGLTESVRQALGEIALEFECEQACLAIRDEELERMFVWKIHPNDREVGGPETLPLSRSDTFLDRRVRNFVLLGIQRWTRNRIWMGPAQRAAVPQLARAAQFHARGIWRAHAAGRDD